MAIPPIPPAPPVKSTSAQIDAGTNNSTFITPANLAGSTYIKPLVTSLSTTGGTTTLTAAQNKSTMFEVTGALTSNATCVVADTMGLFLVENLTTGGFTLTFKTAAGLGITIPQGEIKVLTADGVDVDAVTATGSAGRELLTANRTYYVATTGSDSNTGLTSGTPFLTVQKAVDVVSGTLDIYGFSVTIQVADGTYGGAVVLKEVVGYSSAGCLIIQGNATTPANVLFNHTASDTFTSGTNNIWRIKDIKLSNASSSAFYIQGGKIQVGNINFGACGVAHMLVFGVGSDIEIISAYTITGGALYHVFSQGGRIKNFGNAVTLTGTMTFTQFAYCSFAGSLLDMRYYTFTGGTITGTRYYGELGSVINTNGGGANYFPGSVAGSSTGAYYA